MALVAVDGIFEMVLITDGFLSYDGGKEKLEEGGPGRGIMARRL